MNAFLKIVCADEVRIFSVKSEYLEYAVILSCIEWKPKHFHVIKDVCLTFYAASFPAKAGIFNLLGTPPSFSKFGISAIAP